MKLLTNRPIRLALVALALLLPLQTDRCSDRQWGQEQPQRPKPKPCPQSPVTFGTKPDTGTISDRWGRAPRGILCGEAHAFLIETDTGSVWVSVNRKLADTCGIGQTYYAARGFTSAWCS